jgi:DNA-binding MarR family transcriptional regulator
MSIINDIGELALSTRLTRLSEMIRKDISLIYKQHGIDFESKWFPVLYVLGQRGALSVIELADELGYAHPSVISLVKEMEDKKLVKSVASKTDGRKRMLSLTPRAVVMKNEMQPLWDDMRKVVKRIIDTKHSLLKAIEETETLLKKRSFYERYKKIESK